MDATRLRSPDAPRSRGLDWDPDRGLQGRTTAGVVFVLAFLVAFTVALEWSITTVVPAVAVALTGIDPDISFVLDRRLLVGDLFSDTHPGTADRIERLQSMAADLEGPP